MSSVVAFFFILEVFDMLSGEFTDGVLGSCFYALITERGLLQNHSRSSFSLFTLHKTCFTAAQSSAQMFGWFVGSHVIV